MVQSYDDLKSYQRQKRMVQSYDDLKSYQRQKQTMLVLPNYVLDRIVHTMTGLQERIVRPAYAWITGRLQVLAYAHIPQVCKAMHESHMRVFDHWKRIWTPHIGRLPRYYDEFVTYAQEQLMVYKQQQCQKKWFNHNNIVPVDKKSPGYLDRYKQRHPQGIPDVVPKTEDDFWEVELTRSDNLDHALPIADRRRPWRQRIYDD